MSEPTTPNSDAARADPASAAATAAPAPAAPADTAAKSAAEAPAPAAPSTPAESSPELLTRFFKNSAAARTAASSLKKAAEVAVHFTDAPGDYHFSVADGSPALLPGRAKDADFELTLAPGATKALAARPEADVGDLGILFFQHMVTSDPDAKIRVKLHSGLLKLTMRGYIGVLAAGGPKVFGWLANKGLKGPGAVASALSRLKKS